MAFEDYFDQKIALNDLTGNVVKSAVAQVFAESDTTFSTPLPITDMSGLPQTQLRSSPTGFYPAFKVPGHIQVVAKSGDAITPITSILGYVLGVIPTPVNADDGDVLTVQNGEFILAPSTGGGGGSGILTFAVGEDTSGVPEGAVFGTYVAPVTNTVPQRIGSLTATSGGASTATSIVLNPAAPTEGTAVQVGDWMIAFVGANAPVSGEDWTPPSVDWIDLRGDYSLIGTQRVRVYAKRREVGETTYSFGFAASRHLNAAMIWVRGADVLGTWVVGAAKGRADSPAETVTSTAPAITTSRPASLIVTIGIERTTASEVGVTWSGATQWLFAAQVGSSVITIAVGYSELTSAGTAPAKTITYPNAQSINAWAFQIGIPGV